MAIEAMRAQGYTVDTLILADSTATVLALEQGDLDFAVISDVSGWLAIEKGARLVAVLDDTADSTVLVARKDVKTCADLQGRRLAIPSLVSTRVALVNWYIEQHCPGTRPTFLLVAGDTSRLAGLMAGELDAGIMDMESLARLDSTRREELSTLVSFGDEIPGLSTTTLFTRRELIDTNPETVKDWLRALLLARRRLQDPEVLAAELVTRLEMTPGDAREMAATYLARTYWNVNANFTQETIQRSLDFAIQSLGVRPDLKAGDLSDLTALKAVLDEIGRQ